MKMALQPYCLPQKRGDVDCVDLLIRAGADVNIHDHYHQTPLMFAGRNDHLKCVNHLITAGADVNIQAVDGNTALMFTVYKDNCQCVNELIKSGANVNIPEENGRTPLMFAVNEDHTQCVNELIKAGADVNHQDKDGLTSLTVAVNEDRPQYINELVTAGADVNLSDNNDLTPLMYAVYKNHAQCVNELIKDGAKVNLSDNAGNTPLHDPITMSNEECLKLLIDAGACVNSLNEERRSPLLIALLWSDNKKAPEILIKAGANVNQTLRHGLTSLMYVADKGLPNLQDSMRLLLASGADVNIKDEEGKQALHFATNRPYQESFIEMLLEAGADVNSKDERDQTPLINLLSSDTVREEPTIVNCVNMLINAGANVNAADIDGATALAMATKSGHAKCMLSLLEAGAEVNAGKDKALIMTGQGCHYKSVDILLAAGAYVNATDKYGGNALFLVGLYMFIPRAVGIIKRYPRYIISLLRAGIHINKFRKSKPKGFLGIFQKPQRKNALGIFLEHVWDIKNSNCKFNYKKAAMLLYAAGETLEGVSETKTLEGYTPNPPAVTRDDMIPKELQFEDEKLQLKHICRVAIREHLLKLDPHQHLFRRIPRLGLPSSLTSYLLFYMSLYDDVDDNDYYDVVNHNDDEGSMSWDLKGFIEEQTEPPEM